MELKQILFYIIALLITITATLSVLTYNQSREISTLNENKIDVGLTGNVSELADRGYLRFIVLSDIHVGGDTGNDRPAVMEAANQHPDFVILSGDMVFSDGYNQTEWNILWNETLMLLRNANIPIYPVIGNHDSPFPSPDESNMTFWSEIPWGIDIGKGWYSFIIGNIEFVMIENNYRHTWNCEGYDAYGYVEEQRNFAESALVESPRWLFLVSHKGAYWNTTAHPDTMFGNDDYDYLCNQKVFDEWLDKYQIDMFISGHQHFGDTFFQNGTIYSHVPATYEHHSVIAPHQRGIFGMYDVYASNEQYPEGYIKIRHINFDGQILNDDVFGKNPEFIHEGIVGFPIGLSTLQTVIDKMITRFTLVDILNSSKMLMLPTVLVSGLIGILSIFYRSKSFDFFVTKYMIRVK